MSAGGGFTRTGICTVVDMASLEIDVDVNEMLLAGHLRERVEVLLGDQLPVAHAEHSAHDRYAVEGIGRWVEEMPSIAGNIGWIVRRFKLRSVRTAEPLLQSRCGSCAARVAPAGTRSRRRDLESPA